MKDAEKRLGLLLELRADLKEYKTLDYGGQKILQDLEAWLKDAAKEGDATNGIRALRLQDMRQAFGHSGDIDPSPEETKEMELLIAWEATLLADVEHGRQLLVRAITEVLSATASEPERPDHALVPDELYLALAKPTGKHPVGRLYHLSAIAATFLRVQALANILQEMTEGDSPTLETAMHGLEVAYRLRSPEQA